MKRIKRRSFMQTAVAGLGAGLLAKASPVSGSGLPEGQAEISSSLSDIRLMAMELERIDTHSHYDIRMSELKGEDDFINTPGIVDSSILARGCRKLYGIDSGPFLRPDSPGEIFKRASDLRTKGAEAALETAMETAKISRQFIFNYGVHPKDSRYADFPSRVSLLNYTDDIIAGDTKAFSPDGPDYENFNYYNALCRRLGELNTLSDYLSALDEEIDTWKDYRVVAAKVGLAYSIGLKFSDPSFSEARTAFGKKQDMSREEITIVQHHAFRHMLLACQRNGLPVVVHTGFQIWGHADLQVSNPSNLHNLLIDKRYKDITWVLLHGGNPYVGETTYLARMFPNVYIDFTWISWMTRVRFHMALAEWIEIVPHGKLCWGSDSNSPETIVGIGEITRERIADVLEDQIAHGIMDEKAALDFLEHCFVQTAQRVFQL
ncbi:MAG: amidohydrolase family protein [Bacteroidetes bacterium]|nr:amidohydrolase family protein [Bacteroidota bacterium]